MNNGFRSKGKQNKERRGNQGEQQRNPPTFDGHMDIGQPVLSRVHHHVSTHSFGFDLQKWQQKEIAQGTLEFSQIHQFSFWFRISKDWCFLCRYILAFSRTKTDLSSSWEPFIKSPPIITTKWSFPFLVSLLDQNKKQHASPCPKIENKYEKFSLFFYQNAVHIPNIRNA